MKRALVTGGAGYIGSHTCKLLKQKGYELITIDNLSTGIENSCRWGKNYQTDLLNTASIKRIFSSFRPDIVYHFAASTYVGESVLDPEKYYKNNVLGTMSLLEAMKFSNCGLIVFSSSCAVYGVPTKVPIVEDEKMDPISPYGFTKFTIERILSDYSRAYKIRSVALRYFNAAGADPEGELGENHDPETHLIPLILLSTISGSPISIFGNDYPTPDGTCIRDYIHVNDLAEAHYLAGEYLRRGGESAAFNLGIEKGSSVLEIIKICEKVTGKKIPCLIKPRRPGDPPILIANAEFAKEKLKWFPVFKNLDEIISHAWNWQKNH